MRASGRPTLGCLSKLGVTGGLVDEGLSEGRVSGELECAAAHRGVVGNRRS